MTRFHDCFLANPRLKRWVPGSQMLDKGRVDVLSTLSGAVRLPEVSIGDQPVYLRFALPAMYPLVSPALQARVAVLICVTSLLTAQSIIHNA